MTSGVYLVKCLSNGRQYVGSSSDIRKRWKEHRYDLRHGKHHNRHWQNAWNKYGESQFAWSMLEETPCDDRIIRQREQHWITTLRPEFNVSEYAFPTRLGATASDETKRRMSVGRRAAWSRLSEDERASIRQSIKDGLENIDPEVKRKWHEVGNRNLRVGSNFGKRSDQARANMREAQSKRTPETQQRMKEARAEWLAKQADEKAAKRAEWEMGREAREELRREKLRIANTGKTLSKEQREKIRQAANEQWANPEYRAKHQAATLAAMQDPETLRRLSESHKGKTLSSEHKKKIGQAHKGMKRSPETIARMKAAQLARWKKRKAQEK